MICVSNSKENFMGAFIEAFINTVKTMQSPEMYSLGTHILFNSIAVVCGLVILALFIVPAILTKKNLVISIIAGAVNFVSALVMPTFVWLFHTLPIGIYQFQTQEELYAFFLNLLVKTLIVSGLSMVILAGFVLSIVYIATNFKTKPALFAVFALVLTIARYMFIAPYQTILTMVFKIALASQETLKLVLVVGQSFQFVLYFGVLVVALGLVLAASLINMIKSKKAPEVAPEKAEEKIEAKAEEKAEEKIEAKAEEKTEAKAEVK